MNQLELAIRQRVPSPTAALNALVVMEEELSNVQTYEEIRRVIQEVEAIKVLFRHVEAVKVQAENTILIANKRIAEELAKVPKAAGRPSKNSNDSVKNKSGKGDTGVPPMRRSRLSKLAAAPVERIRAVAEDLRAAGKDATPNAVITVITQGNKAERRAEREAELGNAQAAGNLALPEKRYGVILADPEWRFEVYSRETGMDRAADNHYPTATTDVIASRPVADIAADDCVLFLWATAPMIFDAGRVMEAWGFKYKSQIIWSKDRIGTGYWFRNKHEHLLVGTRGSVPAPAMGTQWFSVMMSAPGEHSEKPDWQYELIEAYFPTLPKIELNARRPRNGWDAWGLDAAWSLPQREAAE